VTLAPLRDRLRREAHRLLVPEDVVERDYALGHVLAALFAQSELADTLVFKGGTALKKAYYGDYRFSVDLDFSAVGGPRGHELEALVRSAGSFAANALAEYGRIEVQVLPRRETRPHPGAQETFKILVQLPWRGRVPSSVKLEITTDEPVLLGSADRPMIHGYDEPLAATLRCYALEEIVAEKLRTLLQARKRVAAGRWVRNCARDYYDLWRLATDEDRDGHGAYTIDWTAVAGILPQKCAIREVGFSSVDEFLDDAIVTEARRQWQGSLATLVGDLPSFDDAIGALRTRLSAML
jgi:hypothetical protein